MKRHWRRQGAPGINNRELNQAAFDASWLAMAETALFSITSSDPTPIVDRGRVALSFGFALTDPGMRLSCTRLFPRVTRVISAPAPMCE